MGVNWAKLKQLMAQPASATNPDRDHELAAMVPELVWELATAGAKEAQMPKPTLVRMEGWHEFAGKGEHAVALPAQARLQDGVVKTPQPSHGGIVIGTVVATHGKSYYARYYNLVHVDVMVEPEHLELARKYEVKVPATEQSVAVATTKGVEYYVGAAVDINLSNGRALVTLPDSKNVQFLGWCKERVNGDGENFVNVQVVNDDVAEIARKLASERKPSLSPAADALLARLKELGKHFRHFLYNIFLHNIYVDELPAANELVKAGLATFPAMEDRYSTNVKYLVVALISEGTGWKAEGTLPPLSDESLNDVRRIMEKPRGDVMVELARAKIVEPTISGHYDFTPAVKARHMRQPKPAEYRMVVRESGAPIPFEGVEFMGYFLHRGQLFRRIGTTESEWALGGLKCSFSQDSVVQPVTITWEKQ